MKFFCVAFFILCSGCALIESDECVNEWRNFNNDNEPETYGFDVGLYKPGIRAYIGRGFWYSSSVPGRIQTTGADVGFTIVSDWSRQKPTQNVEYLVKNPNYEYTWVWSDSGKTVENEIKVGKRSYLHYWRIGRVINGDYTYIAKVYESGANYEDGDGNEIVAAKYEVLTCVPSAITTTTTTTTPTPKTTPSEFQTLMEKILLELQSFKAEINSQIKNLSEQISELKDQNMKFENRIKNIEYAIGFDANQGNISP